MSALPPKADIAVRGSEHVEYEAAVCHHVAANARARNCNFEASVAHITSKKIVSVMQFFASALPTNRQNSYVI
jgi:hypothetical protein